VWTTAGRRNDLVSEEILRLLQVGQAEAWTAGLEDAHDTLTGFSESYAVASYLDFGDICRWLFLISRPDHKRARDTHISLVLSESPTFDAHASPGQPPVISLTLGLFWALDDLVSRLVCLEGFAPGPTQEIAVEATFVEGESFVIDNDLGVSPAIRFYNYAPHQRAGAVEVAALARFFTAVPLSKERQALAQLMVRVGLLWVLLHEESHHVLGHISYRQDMLGASQDSTIHDAADDQITGQANFSKVCEWQSDRDATRGVLDVVIRPAVVDELPPRFRSPRLLLRLVMVAIGCVILLFDRARLLRRALNTTEHGSTHPTERTRYLAAAVHARGQNEHWQATGRPLWLPSDDIDAALIGATRDLAVANRPAAGELWPLPAGWKPPTRHDRTAADVLHMPDWNEATTDPFADLMLHESDDAHLGPILIALRSFPDAAGDPRHENLLRTLHAGLAEQAPELSWESFRALYTKWVGELSAIIDFNDSQVWDLLARYRDDRWV
jgi:hypothetical protein